MRIPIGLIKLLSFIYIAFPFLPFFLGWVKPLYGVPLVLLLLAGAYIYYKELDFKDVYELSKGSLVTILVIIAAWMLFSGAGGFGFQFHDYVKHNSVFKDLADQSWPVSYTIDGEEKYLAHYLGFYLPAPFVLGGIGYKYMQLGVFIYTSIGVFLSMFFLLYHSKSRNGFSPLFFIFFGGVSFISFLVKYKSGVFTELLRRTNEHLYVFWINCWEIIPLNFMGITDMVYWSPQHFITAALGLGVLLYDGQKNKMKTTAFFLSLLAFWSPLVLLGFVPILIYFLVKNNYYKVFNLLNLGIALPIFLVVGSFLMSIEAKELIQGLIINNKTDHSIIKQIGVYFYFILFEVILWSATIFLVLKNKIPKSEVKFFLFVVATLCLIPLYRFGVWNDWCTRVSMPALLVLAIYAKRALTFNKGIILLLLVLGSTGAFIDILGSLKFSNNRVKFQPPLEHQVGNIVETSVSWPVDQFVADKNTFFFKYLAKEK